MYEYKILKAETLINEEQLNRLALEGWRLITIVQNKDGVLYYFYFERSTQDINTVN